MSVLERLAGASGVFWGEGQGPDRAPYAVRVAVRGLPDGSVTVDYESWAPHAGVNHAAAARLVRTGDGVLLTTTSGATGDSLTFREGDSGVFGSTGERRVGLVVDLRPDDVVRLAWWWPDGDGTLREQARAVVRRSRPLDPAPPTGCRGDHDTGPDGAAEGAAEGAAQGAVPWPGILVLDGPGTGVVAHQLAERLTRAAVVRTDLFDATVRGSGVAPDDALRDRVAVAVVGAYAGAAHPVLLYRRGGSSDQRRLVDVLVAAGLGPVRLVEVFAGEGYREVARRLIEAE